MMYLKSSFFKNAFQVVLLFCLSVFPGYAQNNHGAGGWKITGYTFIDGTSNVERVLAGTSSKMNDVAKYTGNKGNVEISKNRWDKKTGALLAGVTYIVKWTDPSDFLYPGDKISMNYELKVVTSKSWIPDNQSVSFGQGMGAVFLLNSKGENYFRTDFKSQLNSSKTVPKGIKNGEEKVLTANFGSGFKAVYTYRWKEF